MAGPDMKMDVTYTRDPRNSVRDHGKILREANRSAAVMHHEEHIPRHFEKFAPSKYGYAPRRSRINSKLTYQQLKDKQGLPPLVSPRATGGKTKHAATTQRTITATQKKSKLIIRLPWRGGTGRFRLLPGERKLTVHQITAQRTVHEIEAVAADEIKANAKHIKDYYIKATNKNDAGKIRKRIN